MFSVLIVLANTPYQLSALFGAINAEYARTTFQAANLQVDIDAGGVRVYVGNDDVSATNWGVKITGSQAVGLNVPGSPNVDPRHLYVMSDTAGVRLGVSLFPL